MFNGVLLSWAFFIYDFHTSWSVLLKFCVCLYVCVCVCVLRTQKFSVDFHIPLLATIKVRLHRFLVKLSEAKHPKVLLFLTFILWGSTSWWCVIHFIFFLFVFYFFFPLYGGGQKIKAKNFSWVAPSRLSIRDTNKESKSFVSRVYKKCESSYLCLWSNVTG